MTNPPTPAAWICAILTFALPIGIYALCIGARSLLAEIIFRVRMRRALRQMRAHQTDPAHLPATFAEILAARGGSYERERERWTPAMGERLTRNTADPCPACQEGCPECSGEGRHTCYAFGCGGRGFLVHATAPCDCTQATLHGGPAANCAACSGTGRKVTQSEPCPVCRGSKIESCSVCRATGQVSTGRDNRGRSAALARGIMQMWSWHKTAPLCPECRGTGWQQEMLTAADEENLLHANKVVARLQKTCV